MSDGAGLNGMAPAQGEGMTPAPGNDQAPPQSVKDAVDERFATSLMQPSEADYEAATDDDAARDTFKRLMGGKDGDGEKIEVDPSASRNPNGQFKRGSPADGQDQPEEPAAKRSAPRNLAPAAHPDWDAAPDSIKEYTERREGDTQRLAADYGRYRQALEPVVDYISGTRERYGDSDPVTGMIEEHRQLSGWHDALASDFGSAVQDLAQAYGYDLSSLFASSPSQQDYQAAAPDDPSDWLSGEPVVKSLRDQLSASNAELASTRAAVAELTGWASQQQQAEAHYRQQQQQHYAAQQQAAEYRQSIEQGIDNVASMLPDFAEYEDALPGMIAAVRNQNPNLSPDALLMHAVNQLRQQRSEADQAGARKARTAEQARRDGSLNLRGSASINHADPFDEEAAGAIAYRRLMSR